MLAKEALRQSPGGAMSPGLTKGPHCLPALAARQQYLVQGCSLCI